MDDATRPDAGEESNYAPLATKADQLLAALAAGPCTLADLATVSRDLYGMLREIRQHGAVILFDRKAKPPIYRLERMPMPSTPKAKPGPKPKPEPEPPPPLKGWLSAESFETPHRPNRRDPPLTLERWQVPRRGRVQVPGGCRGTGRDLSTRTGRDGQRSIP